MKTVKVDLSERSYDIYIGSGLIDVLGKKLSEIISAKKVALISDKNVYNLYGRQAEESLKQAGLEVFGYVADPGEKTKSLKVAEKIYDFLYDAKIERSDVIVALGGGVIGDLTGFIAGTWLRGVPFVQVPTTLEADIDASVGGKTAVNHPKGKNLIGLFNQPKFVLMDTDTLKTLSSRDIRAGLAESIKHAIIRDADFFQYHKENREKILSLDSSIIEDLLARNCSIKAGVVSEDEREANLRAILNFGHTIGHAIESAGLYQLRHGEAVALGMISAGFIAKERKMFSDKEFSEIEHIIREYQLPSRLANLDFDILYELMQRDKKVRAGKIRFVLPRRIGDVEIVNDVTVEQIKSAVEYIGVEN